MLEEPMSYCPFCAYPDPNPYAILLHIEEKHAEGKSPFVADKEHPTGAEDEERQPFPCPIEGCGEPVALNEIEAHMELHGTDGDASDAEAVAVDSKGGPSNTPNLGKGLGALSKKSASASASGPSNGAPKQNAIKKLGRTELGRYHNEERMPERLVALLKKGNYRSSTGVIPVLQQLLEQNRSTEWAYLCAGTAQHIWKLEGEGSFCGYRNIQMLISCVLQLDPAAARLFGGRVPDIFALQDMIEDAWDRGVNAKGRIETGGIRGTRKFIGTPEAAAIFVNLGIRCDTQGFRNAKGEERRAAENRLYDAVERYFAEAPGVSSQAKVRTTQLPPLYFQHRGHSMTIVGIEKRTKGGRGLLVFDPTYSDPTGIRRYVGRKHTHSDPNKKLDIYRRGAHYLGRYREFEILSLK
ncbi:DUF1671-domain-containing protein [Hypoxylon cercidicola]|nr:DUF1671-domain-containing protein [Hypoxylon cercidicola]